MVSVKALICGFLLPVLFAAVLPFLISYKAGGWVRKFTSNPKEFTTADIPVLTGTTAVITGGNTGIGYQTALELARKGATVVLTARNKKKGQAAVQKIKDAVWKDMDKAGLGSPQVEFFELDLASMKSIKKFAVDFMEAEIECNLLILNAGVQKSPGAAFIGKEFWYGYVPTLQGFEGHIGVNYIGHYMLLQMMYKNLKRTARDNEKPSRVVVVSSAAEKGGYKEGINWNLWNCKPRQECLERGYEDGKAYAHSKLALIMMTNEISRRWVNDSINLYSCHPGLIASDINRYVHPVMQREAKSAGMGGIFTALNDFFWKLYESAMFTVEDGALNQLYLATAPETELENGGHYWPIGELAEPDHPQARNATLMKGLYLSTDNWVRTTLQHQR